jgi:hypothetical protein
MKQQGYNHNIRYKDVLFHVQTEDYGAEKASVVTQLFHSGMILHKESRSYQEHLQAPDLSLKITAMMKQQHKQVMRKLLAGEIDLPQNLLPKAQPPQDTQRTLEDEEGDYEKVRNYLGTEEF